MPHKRTAPITCKYSKSEQLYLILLCKPERKMQHTITTSADGSSTLQLTQFGETYHSTNGAYTEATHIYIQCGLEHLFRNCSAAQINIFDVGFGTGLNCILAWAWQQQLRQKGLPYPRIIYHGIEKYPIPLSEIEQLNYHTIIAQHTELLPDNLAEVFHLMHNCPWEEDIQIEPDFVLHKSFADIAALGKEYYREASSKKENRCSTDTATAVVFYDTFSPATQPELWDEGIFRTIAAGCPAGSTLVTYCSKGTVKQALRNAGFTLERLAGPPGKRHILRGTL